MIFAPKEPLGQGEMSNGVRRGHTPGQAKEDEALTKLLFGQVSSVDKNVSNTDVMNNADNTSKVVKGKGKRKEEEAPMAVWHDDDDEDININLEDTNRLKKLKKDGQSTIKGNQYTDLLQERFKTKQLQWAQFDDKPNEIDALLQTTGTMLGQTNNSKTKIISPGKIDITRVVDGNIQDPSNDAITTVKFHSNSNLLMVGSMDKYLKFFNIDGDKNTRQLTVKFNDMSILAAAFLGPSAQVVVSGRKPYYYSYDTVNGTVLKVPGLHGKHIKSYENLTVSPEGSKIAFGGSGGYVYVCDGRLKTMMMELKMNSGVRALTFIDEMTLVTSGVDADVYVWDLRKNGRCCKRFTHDDGTCTSNLSACRSSSSSHYLAVGAESGVVSIFNSSFSAANMSGDRSPPAALKSVMNLTTKVDGMTFHPSGQILAISSEQKTDQLKLVHLPTCTVFSNWPTSKTPVRKVKCMEFSNNGEYFAVGNSRGKVLLYRVNKFSSV